MNKVLNGLLIFKKYCDDCDFSAGHDEIFSGCKSVYENLTKEDLKILEENGWRWNDELECFSRFI